jgi:hypothetical protein
MHSQVFFDVIIGDTIALMKTIHPSKMTRLKRHQNALVELSIALK